MNHFFGFRDIDFRQIEGTHWRKELALDLIEFLGREYKAWPIYGRQGMHIGPEQDGQPEVEAAKLFVATDNDGDGHVAYGMYIESAEKSAAHRFRHWQNFRDGLLDTDRMRRTLASVMAKHDLTVGRYAGDEDHDPHWRFEYRDGQLEQVIGRLRQGTTVELLAEKIGELPKNAWVDMYVFAAMTRTNAIALREDVTGIIGRVLLDLIPLYFQIISR